jgi:hypothetical protein
VKVKDYHNNLYINNKFDITMDLRQAKQELNRFKGQLHSPEGLKILRDYADAVINATAPVRKQFWEEERRYAEGF